MRLESAQSAHDLPTNESQFYQHVRRLTAALLGWERVEPSNESGFPDTYFVLRPESGRRGEGTVEFKYKRVKGEPDLSSGLMRGTQKAALLEYWQMGGRRRWVLSLCGAGLVRLYTTEEAVAAIRGAKEACGWAVALGAADFAQRLTRALAQE